MSPERKYPIRSTWKSQILWLLTTIFSSSNKSSKIYRWVLASKSTPEYLHKTKLSLWGPSNNRSLPSEMPSLWFKELWELKSTRWEWLEMEPMIFLPSERQISEWASVTVTQAMLPAFLYKHFQVLTFWYDNLNAASDQLSKLSDSSLSPPLLMFP